MDTGSPEKLPQFLIVSFSVSFPGLTPLSDDSVPHILSCFTYSIAALNSALLALMLQQLTKSNCMFEIPGAGKMSVLEWFVWSGCESRVCTDLLRSRWEFPFTDLGLLVGSGLTHDAIDYMVVSLSSFDNNPYVFGVESSNCYK